LFDELVLPGRSQKFATKCQSAQKANSKWWQALPRFLGCTSAPQPGAVGGSAWSAPGGDGVYWLGAAPISRRCNNPKLYCCF
jgi:hypothetical protein